MFSTVDWIIIAAYRVSAFVAGVWMTRTAGRGLTSYFVADRSLPWWCLGTSMVATTFAADTPLAIAGIIANNGISGNWFWWSWVLTFVTVTVFFARKWCLSGVLTDVELTELRYEGRSASGENLRPNRMIKRISFAKYACGFWGLRLRSVEWSASVILSDRTGRPAWLCC